MPEKRASGKQPQKRKSTTFPRGKHARSRASRQGYASGRLPENLPLSLSGSESLAEVVVAKPSSHPNLFRKRLVRIQGKPQVGDWVSVVVEQEHEETGEFLRSQLGYGWYNPKSEIAVRMVKWSDGMPDDAFWTQRMERAVSLRCKELLLDREVDCYRVLHAEADGVPGLVVDRFGDCLSAEVFSAAVAPRARQILQGLQQLLGTEHWLIQPGPHLQPQEGFQLRSTRSQRLPSQLQVHEGDVQFLVRFADSHKTGFFCDQRENRARLAEFTRGKSVLDLCCYTGGFSVSAAKAGQAESVIGVDLDAAPLEIARRNAAINQVKAKFTQADAFAYMRDMLRGGKQFDVVVLDPPKLIRNRSELEEGTRKHFDLNRLAMQLVRPGGILLSCSCAGLLHTADFTRLVRAAARNAFLPTDFNPNPTPRDMQILAHSGAAACHPVAANCPETEYLKAMWLRL
ncbi:MAG: class I SAM-dependent rRNA methyltransferase [Planctomycetota bacterium]